MTGNNSTNMRECGLGSAKGLIKVAGELVAVPHDAPKTGFKAPNAYGAKPLFDGTTTNKIFQTSVRTVDKTQEKDKELAPYYPNAARNRPKEELENTVGQRFGPHPTSKTETYRGASQVSFATPYDPEGSKPWKTTNQVFAECTKVTNITGLGNPGVSSDVAKRMHKKQGIY